MKKKEKNDFELFKKRADKCKTEEEMDILLENELYNKVDNNELLNYIIENGNIGEYADNIEDITLDLFDENEIKRYKKEYLLKEDERISNLSIDEFLNEINC